MYRFKPPFRPPCCNHARSILTISEASLHLHHTFRTRRRLPQPSCLRFRPGKRFLNSCHDEVHKPILVRARHDQGSDLSTLIPNHPDRPRLPPGRRTQSLVLWLFPFLEWVAFSSKPLTTRVALVVAPRNCLHATSSWTDPAEFHGTTSHPRTRWISFWNDCGQCTCHDMVDGGRLDQVERWSRSSSSGYETCEVS